jgi:anti-anti-sigma factor
MSDHAMGLQIAGGAGGERHLVLQGEIDAHTAPDLEVRLASLGDGDDVTVDLHDVSFIDSSGLRVIITAHTALEAAGHQLKLPSPSAPVRRLMDITGLTEHLRLS